MNRPRPCRFFHRWEYIDAFIDMFSVVERCRKCGLHRATNLFTEAARYGYPNEEEPRND